MPNPKKKSPARESLQVVETPEEEVETTEEVAEEQVDASELPKPVEVPLAEIPFRGKVFVIPRNRDDWSTEGLAHLAEEKYNLFVKYTLEIAEPGQWNLLCMLCPRRRDFAEFFVLFGKVLKEECFG